jgi:two-component system cell cycle response regulator
MPRDDDDDDLDRTKLGIEPLRTRRSDSDRPHLIVLAGTNVGEMYALDGPEVVVGRGDTATIRLQDDSISRKHAIIRIAGGDVRVEDLGSANGTLVNGALVTTAPLRDGDKIQLGATTILKFTYHDRLEEEFQRQMYEAALRDPLTKAFNKKHLLDRLSVEVAFANRHQSPLSLVMLDIDHFKKVNDTHGHLAGDFVLAHLAAAVQAVLRSEDLFGRYGGEEFAIVCRGATVAEAQVVAERIRATVHGTSFVYEGRTIPVTVSLGVAPLAGSSSTDLVAAADRALYEAKRGGRNRVVVGGGR